jgi:hypothetical protein
MVDTFFAYDLTLKLYSKNRKIKFCRIDSRIMSVLWKEGKLKLAKNLRMNTASHFGSLFPSITISRSLNIIQAHLVANIEHSPSWYYIMMRVFCLFLFTLANFLLFIRFFPSLIHFKLKNPIFFFFTFTNNIYLWNSKEGALFPSHRICECERDSVCVCACVCVCV